MEDFEELKMQRNLKFIIELLNVLLNILLNYCIIELILNVLKIFKIKTCICII